MKLSKKDIETIIDWIGVCESEGIGKENFENGLSLSERIKVEAKRFGIIWPSWLHTSEDIEKSRRDATKTR